MPLDTSQPIPEPSPAEPIYRLYTGLARTLAFDEHSGLGGKLLYAGDIDQGRSLLFAANIAGAASLAASADHAALRQAMRDGVVDFIVTSLEEALRILKNEIRKRQTVSVGIAADLDRLVVQMLDRGVLPDLLPGSLDPVQAGQFLAQGARQVVEPGESGGEFVTWSVDRDFARWLPRLDVCALTILPTEDFLRQRWLRLAPRYLGRLVQKQHGVVLTASEQRRFEAEVEQALAAQITQSGEKPDVTIHSGGLRR